MVHQIPKQLSLEEVEGLGNLAPDERVRRLETLIERLVSGASDAEVAAFLAATAADEVEVSVRDAWVSYAAASRNENFLLVLAKWIADDRWENRRHVLYALMEIPSPEVNHILLDLIEHNGDRVLRRLALRSLVRRGSLGKWEPVDLTSITESEDWFGPTRREYVELLQRGKTKP